MTNRPNRGWRIRGNTARAVIKRKSDPLEITMALESQPNGKQSLTMKAEPMPGSSADPPKLANYEFAPGKGPSPYRRKNFPAPLRDNQAGRQEKTQEGQEA